MALNGVRALLFDVFGTVVDWRSGVAREAAPFLRRRGAESVDPLAFADAWRAGYQPAMEQVRSGRRRFTRLDVLHRENLETILPDFGIDPATVPASELNELNLAWHRLDPWPDAVAGLTRLKTSFIIAPLSNGNIALMLDMAKRAGLPWDAILGAEVVQAYKPMPEAYLRTADILAMRRNKSASWPRTTATSRRRVSAVCEPPSYRVPPSTVRTRLPICAPSRSGTWSPPTSALWPRSSRCNWIFGSALQASRPGVVGPSAANPSLYATARRPLNSVCSAAPPRVPRDNARSRAHHRGL